MDPIIKNEALLRALIDKNPEELERLTQQRVMAEHFDALLRQAVANWEMQRSKNGKPGEQNILLTSSLTPADFSKQIIDLEKLNTSPMGGGGAALANFLQHIGGELHPLPKGLGGLGYGASSSVSALQIYANGSLLSVRNIASHWSNQEVTRIYVSDILTAIINLLALAKHLYHQTDHTGEIVGDIHVEPCEGAEVGRITGPRYRPFDTPPLTLLDRYSWRFGLTPEILNDKTQLKQLVENLAQRIHWDLGISSNKEDTQDWLGKQPEFM